MTLRTTLTCLIGALGLSGLVLSGWLGLSAARSYGGTLAATETETGRAALVSLVEALYARDIATIDILSMQGAPDPAAALRVTRALDAAAAHFTAAATSDPAAAAVLAAYAAALARQTRALAASVSGGRSTGAAVFDWQRRMTPLFRQVELLSTRGPPADQSADPALLALTTLRETALRGYAAIVTHRVLIETRLAGGAASPDWATRGFALRLGASTASAAGTAGAMGPLVALLPEPAAGQTRLALNRLAREYGPTEDRLLAALSAGSFSAGDLGQWRDMSRRALDQLSVATAALNTETARHLAVSLRHARRNLVLAATAGAALPLLAAFALRLVQVRVCQPLGRIQTRLGRLATDDFAHDGSPDPTFPEIAALDAALDRLCDEGLRRTKVQAELARLSDRAVATNRHMAEDLEAAARVQRAQLPAAPCSFPAGVFSAFFRPSRVIAGDTYDCLVLPDGRTRVFQIDVSGHGAPAALVSVASHIALKQALLCAPPSEPLAAVIARTNRDWAEDLPYFTLLAVEIDPTRASASVVQCGHPALIRLPATGGAEVLGDGGLPIGVLPDAGFSTLTCPFLPGDRLVLATDGVTETADPDLRMFGDARFRDLLTHRPHEPVQRLFDRIERALWDWRGSEILDDDITILVLEAA